MSAEVRSLEWSAYRIPTDAPEADGTLEWDATTVVVVHASAAGATGLGWTYAPAAAGHLVGELLAPHVLGRDAFDVPAANAAMARAVRNAGRPGVAATAISAVDVALWDLKARLLGVSLAVLLGRARDAVPVYASGGFVTWSDDRLRAWLDEHAGIPRAKIKIGGGPEDADLRRIGVARDALGPDRELYVDANGAYTAKQAIRFAAAFPDVRWFEEPVSSDDLDGLRRVRDAVRPDVAAGEYGYDLRYFARLAPVVDCLQADASRCGGITEWQRVAALAASVGLEVSGHCAPALHLGAALATTNLRHLEYFHDHVRIEALLFDGVATPGPGGVLRPAGDAVGHGLVLRPQDARPYLVATGYADH
ncbi:enolase C-terminal domain-like protein [Dactylosporangium sp. AC04546]|uniref:enolase C-terminal domain-like protein n=1 Tax=Dactylosporangium sp. AC04546 TaxID=2862460 RepID=UPI001EE14C4F|nr:enolase C-terminal domain-like protein [Dactylosporangium sp. AC04546]WVK78781.1 enolase C-terminal domain-like protein [Dactylosporangium sp. AC04546]